MMKILDKWLMTFLILIIYMGMGIYLIEKTLIDGAAAWFVMGGIAVIVLECAMWYDEV